MTYHRVCNKRNTTGATGGTGTAYPSGEHSRLLVGFVLFDRVVVCRLLVFLLFFFFWPLYCLSFFLLLLAAVLSVLLFFFFWPLYCLSFFLLLLAAVLSVLLPSSFGRCIVCPSSFFDLRLLVFSNFSYCISYY